MIMQIAQTATQMSQAQLGYNVGIAVAKKGLDAYEAQGEAVVQLLEAAAQMSKAIGLGENFDAVG